MKLAKWALGRLSDADLVKLEDDYNDGYRNDGKDPEFRRVVHDLDYDLSQSVTARLDQMAP